MYEIPREVFLAMLGGAFVLGGVLAWLATGLLIPPRMKAHYESVWRERREALKALKEAEERERRLGMELAFWERGGVSTERLREWGESYGAREPWDDEPQYEIADGINVVHTDWRPEGDD